ncbi:MAG: hypothetical protein AB7F88_01660 [Pyrinomonadaceae bacterium]
MTTTTKAYLAAGVVTVISVALIAASLWSDHKLAEADRELQLARSNAETVETRSRELENAAAVYKQKIKYLEASLSDIGRIASQQDEQIKLLATDTSNARLTADRSRRVERVASAAAELCRKLAELGHPCE